MDFDFDHTSFAVTDALAVAGWLRREFGAVPIAGEVLPEFRYLLLHVGTVDRGARIELMEPAGVGFLARFLERSGEGPHHLTFTVPDLAEAVLRTRALGLTVVGESCDHAGWCEAFVMPDSVHGTVIQLASSDMTYPSPEELLASRERDVSTMPTVAGATDPDWWTSLWDTEPLERTGWVGATHLVSGDPSLSRELFEAVLGGRIIGDHEAGEAEGHQGHQAFPITWPSGDLCVSSGEVIGVRRVERHGGAGGDGAIGGREFISSA